MGSQWMSSSQAAAALGVKPASLYAYVSRGVIARHIAIVDGRRVSRFARVDVAALAEQRARPRSGALTTLIESDVTALDANGSLAFRGVPVTTCATWGFERTALHVLGVPSAQWPTQPPIPHSNFQSSSSTTASDRLRHLVLDLAGRDACRANTDPAHCRQVALDLVEASTRMLTGMTTGSVATRLATSWTANRRQGTPPSAQTTPITSAITGVDAALAVLVDHELTASTLAARAAAGVCADPWMVLLTGLAAMSGSSQAGASRKALSVLRAWGEGVKPPLDAPIPGFGHQVYLGSDPRAELVLAEVARIDEDIADIVESLATYIARSRGLYPNIDIALAGLTLAARLPDDAGELIFTLARIPGLMAHAMEEYPHGLRLRPRALT